MRLVCACLGVALLTSAAQAAELNTLVDVGKALDACFVPPPPEQAREDMEITVLVSFKRDGTILGEPRFTFVTRDAPVPTRVAYQRAIADALGRCTPLSFTPGLAGAVAGRPFAWRVVDRRPGKRA